MAITMNRYEKCKVCKKQLVVKTYFDVKQGIYYKQNYYCTKCFDKQKKFGATLGDIL